LGDWKREGQLQLRNPAKGREGEKETQVKESTLWLKTQSWHSVSILCSASLRMVPQRLTTFPFTANVRFMGISQSKTRKERDFM